MALMRIMYDRLMALMRIMYERRNHEMVKKRKGTTRTRSYNLRLVFDLYFCLKCYLFW